MLGGYQFFCIYVSFDLKNDFSGIRVEFLIYTYISRIWNFFLKSESGFTIWNISPSNIQGNAHNLNNNINFLNLKTLYTKG
jgi:hypothetical protein